MSTKFVNLVDQSQHVVATAHVAEKEGCFAGVIDLTPMPEALRQKFEEYEEIVNGQMFSLLDEIEEQIGALPLKVVFPEGHEACVEDLQIYPSTQRVSFKVVKETAHPSSWTLQSAAVDRAGITASEA